LRPLSHRATPFIILSVSAGRQGVWLCCAGAALTIPVAFNAIGDTVRVCLRAIP
jgi:hypothetical protein